jgi:pimeloyl-ACP methyl ester carboxylesterase
VPELSVDGATIHYEDVGAGAPLVLVHGGAASTRSVGPLIAGLSDEFRVVAADLRGMGRSSAVDEMPPTAWNDDLVALLDALDLEAAHLLGVSLGARIVLRAAVDVPSRVRSIVVDAPILEDSAEGSAAVELVFGAGMPAELAAGLERWNGTQWRDVVDRYLRLRVTPGLQEYYSVRDALDSLDVPAFVCRGDVDDPIHPISHAVEAHRRLAESRLWIAPATGFSATRYRPDDALVQIRAFLGGVE